MKTWLINKWANIRTTFWFTPSLYITGAVLLAVAALKLDSRFPITDWDAGDWHKARWITVTDAAARITLGTLVGALFTVTGVVFSLTMLLLSQTTSQYGPRLVRTFMQHSVPQATLGIFLGSSVYCLIVLRSIRETTEQDSGFVPNFAVLLGELGGGLCLVALIAFLHFVSQSIRAETVVKSVYDDLCDVIARLYPDNSTRSVSPPQAAGSRRDLLEGDYNAEVSSAFPVVVRATQDGYLQDIHLDGLVEIVRGAEAQLRLTVTPGDYLVHGDSLAHSTTPVDCSAADYAAQLTQHFYYGSRRTPRQDIECAVSELAEVAIRALSPGINDPFTASSCIDYLSAAMCRLLERPAPSLVVTDAEGIPRIHVRPRSFEHLLSTALDQIRLYGKADPKVLERIASMLDRLESRSTDAGVIEVIQSQRSRLLQTVRQSLDDELLRDRLIDRCERRESGSAE